MLAILRSLLASAVMDGVIAANPATGIGRQFKLVQGARSRQDGVASKAMSREQLAAFLACSREARRTPTGASTRSS